MNNVKFSTKIFFILIISITVFVGSFSFVSSAHKGNVDSQSGFTPASPVYFIDTLFENINLFFVFNKEAKSLIYIDLISERFSEIKVMLSRRDEINESNLDTAERKVKEHISEIYNLLDKMKKEGKEVGSIAKKIDKSFNEVVSNFDDDIDRLISELDKERKEIKDRIKNPSEITSEIDRNNFNEIYSKIDDIRFVNSQSIRIKNSIMKEEKQVEDFMLDINRIKNNFSEVKEKFSYLKEEVDEKNFDLPNGYFNNLAYYTFINNAESQIENLNFPEASENIKKAKESVNSFKDLVKEKRESLLRKYESEIRILEAENSFKELKEVPTEVKKSYTRFISRARAEFNAGNFDKAEESAKQAKEVIIKEN